MSVINAVSGPGGATSSPPRPSPPKAEGYSAAQPPRPAASAPVKKAEPIRYFGGIEGMNAANLIVALQSNGAVSGGYSAQAIETGGTPPPAIVDKGA